METTTVSTTLTPGDWIELDYGYNSPCIFYVIRTTERGVWVTSPKWLVSSQIMFKWEELKQKNTVLIGEGKLRRWRALLPFIRNLIPMYSKPKALKD